MSTTPVAFIVFNRPDKAERVLKAVAAYRPERVFVIADGARADRPDDIERTEATLAVFDRIDWPCDLMMNVAPTNMGVDPRIVSGITWVFEHVEDAIILEDDCVPHPSFFRFAHEMLERYRDEPRVMTVSGNNFADGYRRGNDSYHFSRFPLTTGFATWRRAWGHYTDDVSQLANVGDISELRALFASHDQADYWHRLYELHASGQRAAWDQRWCLCSMANDGLTVVPNWNLIENIGFTPDATHIKAPTLFSVVKAVEIPVPLVHPSAIEPDRAADMRTFRLRMQGGGWLADRLFRLVRKLHLQRLIPIVEFVRQVTGALARSLRFGV